jgi:hypothetical protein
MVLAPMQRIDSTHSTWLFDPERMRFCRIPKGVDASALPLEREWEPYYALDVDASGAFTVALNADRTRLLRAWQEPSDDGAQATAELELLHEAVE